jgi:hypothetical protein
MIKYIKLIIGQIVIQVASFIILGILLLGTYILDPNNSIFSFTIYGVSAILFYHYCRRYNLINFILIAALYSLLIIIAFQKTSHIVKLGRNISWFILIGLLTYSLTVIEKQEWYLKSKAWIISYWLFGFILVYIVMTILNIYVFGFYLVDEKYTFWLFLKQSVKIGGILGLGIGLGSLINSYIFKKNITQISKQT